MDRWTVIESFFNEKGFVRQHLDSFNDFVERRLQEVIDEQAKIETDIEGFYVKFGKIRAGEPVYKEADGSKRDFFPQEATIFPGRESKSFLFHYTFGKRDGVFLHFITRLA